MDISSLISKNYFHFHDHSFKRKGQKNFPSTKATLLLQMITCITTPTERMIIKHGDKVDAPKSRLFDWSHATSKGPTTTEQSKMSRSCIIYPHSVLSVESTQPATGLNIPPRVESIFSREREKEGKG